MSGLRAVDILFSVNTYDRDGDLETKGIYLHFGPACVLVADNVDGFRKVAERISGMIKEIEENYPEASA